MQKKKLISPKIHQKKRYLCIQLPALILVYSHKGRRCRKYYNIIIIIDTAVKTCLVKSFHNNKYANLRFTTFSLVLLMDFILHY